MNIWYNEYHKIKRNLKELCVIHKKQEKWDRGIFVWDFQSVVVTWLVLAYNTNSNSNINNNTNMQVNASDIYKVFKIWKGSVLLKGLMCNLP